MEDGFVYAEKWREGMGISIGFETHHSI